MEDTNNINLHKFRVDTTGVKNLYFKDAWDKYRLLGGNVDWETALKLINDFLEEHSFKSYYKRTWETSEGIMIDVGSYVEFFLWGK